MIFNETISSRQPAICKAVLLLTTFIKNLLDNWFSIVYRDKSFIQFHLDEITPIRLPGLLEKTKTLNPAGRLTGTIVNKPV